MDFYNPLYWVIKGGFYTSFKSIYPAINYFILKPFSFGIDPNIISSPFELRRLFPILGWLNTGFYLLIILFIINIGKWKEINSVNKFWVFCICVLGAPVLFGLERGNMIFWALPFLALYLSTSNQWLKAVFFGILVNIKPYFGILLLQYLNISNLDKLQFARSIFSSLFIFIALGLLVKLNFIRFLEFYLLFSKKGAITAEGIIAIPHNLMALSFINNFISYSNGHSYTFWFSLLKVIGYLSVFILILLTILKPLSRLEILISSFVIITNFSISTGGYILIIYIVLIPYLLNSEEYKKIVLPIMIIYALPMDWVRIVRVGVNENISYLGGNIILEDISMWVGLGSIVRPLMNFAIIAFFITHLLKKYPINIRWKREMAH